MRALLAATAGLLSLLLVGAPAAADDPTGASIAHVEVRKAGLEVLVSVPAGAEVRLDQVTATVDGRDAAAEAVRAASSTAVRRTAVLAIDTSRSMAGARFEAARAAAAAFLAAVPPDVEVGIVTFADEVSQALPPTVDRAEAAAVLDQLTLSRQTRLYDGVQAAVAMAGGEGQRSVLVLSDGADTTGVDVADTVAAVSEAEVLLDVVALEQTPESLARLEELAAAGAGTVVEADQDALVAAFDAEAAVLARQLLVSVDVPDDVTGTEATLQITLPAGGEPLVVQAFTTVQRHKPQAPAVAPPVVADDTGWVPPRWLMYAGVGVFGAGLLALAVLLVPGRRAELSMADRVARYADTTTTEQPGHRVDAEQALSQATDAAAQVLNRNKGLDVRITRRLEAAGSELKSSEWLLVHTGVVVVAGLLGLLLGGGSLLLGIVFLALGAIGPWAWLGLRRSKRRKAFNAALPDTLQLMSGSLSAGLSLAQSVDTVVREGADPVSGEFKRVLVETRLGVSLEEALDGVAERFDSKDFEWVVMAIRIQRQVGGNLGELLDTVAATMREREYVRRQVSALAAEGKLSAIVLSALPPGFLLYLVVSNGDYVAPLFSDPRGWVMLGGATLWLGVGVFWMSRVVKVEV
ncbi:type II secretion system F family protein [Nocardioides ferulae]|uniref:type II secretion system F family protein n=1 Tax=Nocardioides ferulae TaxID=2340821 RepID=UPI000EAD8E63|nr:type II secretion system F family protein [Nocardioides ferulae]